MALSLVECPDCLIPLGKYTLCTPTNLNRVFYKCLNYGKKGACKTFLWEDDCEDIIEDSSLKKDATEALMKMKSNAGILHVMVKIVLAVSVVTSMLVFRNFIVMMLKY